MVLCPIQAPKKLAAILSKVFPCRDFFSHDPFGDDIFKEFFGGIFFLFFVKLFAFFICRLCLYVLTDVFAAFISSIVSIL